MKNHKYIAFDLTDHEFELFKTEKEAKQWIFDIDGSEGYSEEIIAGMAGVAKITHFTKFKIVDRKENYTDDDGDDPWPYSDAFNEIGTLLLERVNK